ncbi:MAG: hypothetical protein R6V21_04030 [Pelovirga sp.]
MRIHVILTLLMVALLLPACGKKGPVRPLTKTTVEQPTSAAEKTSEESNK